MKQDRLTDVGVGFVYFHSSDNTTKHSLEQDILKVTKKYIFALFWFTVLGKYDKYLWWNKLSYSHTCDNMFIICHFLFLCITLWAMRKSSAQASDCMFQVRMKSKELMALPHVILLAILIDFKSISCALLIQTWLGMLLWNIYIVQTKYNGTFKFISRILFFLHTDQHFNKPFKSKTRDLFSIQQFFSVYTIKSSCSSCQQFWSI